MQMYTAIGNAFEILRSEKVSHVSISCSQKQNWLNGVYHHCACTAIQSWKLLVGWRFLRECSTTEAEGTSLPYLTDTAASHMDTPS
jgi:hypothetical protein